MTRRGKWAEAARDLFLYRSSVSTPRTARRNAAYLVLIVVPILWLYRPVLFRLAPLYPDYHLWFSVEQAVNLKLCGGPARLGKPFASRLEDPSLLDTPLVDVPNMPVREYCATLERAFLNNENSLMLTLRTALAVCPHLSLRGWGRLLRALETGCLALFCFALLSAGASVAFAAAMFLVSVQTLLNNTLCYSVYPLALACLLAGIALCSLAAGATPEPSWRNHFLKCAALGLFVFFASNVRTSYFPIFLVLVAGYGLAQAARIAPARPLVHRLAWAGTAVAVVVGVHGAGSLVLVRALDPSGAARQQGDYWYHTVAHPVVLGLANPETDFSRSEGIEWRDAVGGKLARRVDPEASYMGERYERALWKYYFQLWKEHPKEMLETYIGKVKLAGKLYPSTAAPYGGRVLQRLIAPLTKARGGIEIAVVYCLLAAAGGTLAFRRGSRAGLIVFFVSVTALLIQMEAVFTVPNFYIHLHGFWLVSASFVSLCAIQVFVNVVSDWLQARPRDYSEVTGMKATRVAERTIEDFGEQWSRYPDDEGFYASRQLLEDVLGPLVSLDALRGKRVADLGAGTGRFTVALVEAGVESVLAVEPSEAFVVLERKTAACGKRVVTLRERADELPRGADLDAILSIGVLHHIPNPQPAVRAAFDALRPGGVLVVWLYGVEGNRLYLAFVRPLLLLTRRLPHAYLAALASMLSWPMRAYVGLARRVPVPLSGYLRNVFGELGPRVQRLVIYDQLNPAYAKYYREAEARGLLESAGFQNVRLHHRHGYSWTVIGVKPGEVH